MNSLIKHNEPTYSILQSFQDNCNKVAEEEWNKEDSIHKIDIDHFKEDDNTNVGLSYFKRFIFLSALEQLNMLNAISEFIQIDLHNGLLKKSMISDYKDLIDECYEFTKRK